MSLNNSLMALYQSNNLVKYYTQHFKFSSGLFTDSAYIDHIEIKDNMIIISFPEQIDIISNIQIYGGKHKIMFNNMELNSNIINLRKFRNARLVVYNIENYNSLIINFDVYLFKRQLVSSL
jgi:hypothetical protein